MNQCFKVNVVDCPVSFCLVADWRRVSPCPGWAGSVNTWCEALRNVSHACTEESAISSSWRLLHFLEQHNVAATSMWRYLTFQTPSYITTTQTVMADLRFNLETEINIAPCEATPYCSGRVVCPRDPGTSRCWKTRETRAPSWRQAWKGNLLASTCWLSLKRGWTLSFSRVVPGERHWAGVGILTSPQLSTGLLEFSPMNEGCFHATADYCAFLESLVESWKGCHAGIPKFYWENSVLKWEITDKHGGVWLEGTVCLIWTWAPLW